MEEYPEPITASKNGTFNKASHNHGQPLRKKTPSQASKKTSNIPPFNELVLVKDSTLKIAKEGRGRLKHILIEKLVL